MSYLKYINDERINIARGLVRDTTFEHKFGAVPSMSVDTEGTVWDVDDTNYPWSAFNTENTATIATTLANGNASTLDNGKTVTFYGLDNDYNIQEETVTISGSSATTTKSFKRLYRAFVNGGTNSTQVRASVNGTEVLRVNIGKAQTLMAIYTVPANYTAYLTKGTMSIQSGGDATGEMFVRYFGQTAFRVGHSFEVSGDGSQYLYEFSVPLAIPEKSDIDVRAICRSNNSRITAAFDLILHKDTGTGLRP